MDKIVYVHYGNTKFDPERGFPIKNKSGWTKPIGGLWASRRDASFGWKEWCTEEEFRECAPDNSFKFTLADESRAVRVSNLTQLQQLPKMECPATIFGYNIDFEKCVQMGIDAIELCWYGEEFADIAGDNLYHELYCWDCDSIVILNPNIVNPVSGGNHMKCEVCGKEIEKSLSQSHTVCSSECLSATECLYWLKEHQKRPDEWIVCKGERYHIDSEDAPLSVHGFYGAAFYIQFLDTGKVIKSTNLRHNGDVPDVLRERLPDNVRFISKEEYDRILSGAEKTTEFSS